MSSEQQPHVRPAWVRVVLWGIRSRTVAWLVVWICAALAAFLPHVIDVVFALAALAYLAAIGWMDRHAAWLDGSTGPLVPALIPWTALIALLVLTLTSSSLCGSGASTCQAVGSLAVAAAIALFVALGSTAAGLAILLVRTRRERLG